MQIDPALVAILTTIGGVIAGIVAIEKMLIPTDELSDRQVKGLVIATAAAVLVLAMWSGIVGGSPFAMLESWVYLVLSAIGGREVVAAAPVVGSKLSPPKPPSA